MTVSKQNGPPSWTLFIGPLTATVAERRVLARSGQDALQCSRGPTDVSHVSVGNALPRDSLSFSLTENVPTMVNTPSRNQRTHTNKLTSLMPLPYTVRGALANPRLGHSVPMYKAKPWTKLGQEIDNKLFTLSLTLLSSLFVSLT
ncbi:hypothetical protein GW17_00035773 [Ensete ventricosum]|nr:hypothetical protein GW17_00035773 [Ensete ventricosum]